MADVNGELICTSTNYFDVGVFDVPNDSEYHPNLEVSFSDPGIFDAPRPGWYSQTDSKVVITNHYHKRGWRTESDAYVEWESTDRNTPYPGGGTVEPAVGTVVFQWTTTSNGSSPG
jgi:hypothetical protein